MCENTLMILSSSAYYIHCSPHECLELQVSLLGAKYIYIFVVGFDTSAMTYIWQCVNV